ncbi:MAG: hypothetical protein ACYDHX_13365 [Methanothrix sp.]
MYENAAGLGGMSRPRFSRPGISCGNPLMGQRGLGIYPEDAAAGRSPGTLGARLPGGLARAQIVFPVLM